MDKYAIDKEVIDVITTLSIAYRLHKGKKHKMKSIAKTISKRAYFPQSKGYCNLIIKKPDSAETILNYVTRTLYGREILKITEII